MAQRRLAGIPEFRTSGDARDAFDAINVMRDSLNRHPFIVRDGVLFSGTLSVGDNTINHGLGRTPAGWLVTRSVGAAATMYEVSGSANDRTITLNSAGAPEVSIWFF